MDAHNGQIDAQNEGMNAWIEVTNAHNGEQMLGMRRKMLEMGEWTLGMGEWMLRMTK